MIRLLAGTLLTACASPQRATLDLRQDAAAVLSSCEDDVILDAAARNGVQLALAPCGHNRVAAASWSPDGRLLLIRLGTTAYVMDPASRRFARLTAEAVVGDGVWVASRRVAVPLGASEEGENLRLAEVDVLEEGSPTAVFVERLPWMTGGVDLLGRLPDGRWWALVQPTAGQHGERRGWAWLPAGEAAPWPTDGILHGATLAAGGREALVADDAGLTLVDTASGALGRRWPEASAGALDPTGRWVLATVPTTQRIGERDGERPDLWLFDRRGEGRWRLDGLHGDAPGWYPGASGWITWRLWGLEQTQLRRNVALLDAGARLDGLAAGRAVWGATPGD